MELVNKFWASSDVNIAQINGNTVDVGIDVSGLATPRVTIATDDPINSYILSSAVISASTNGIAAAVGNGLVGKTTGGDFTVTWVDSETLSVTGLPSWYPTLRNTDILSVTIIDTTGSAYTIYNRTDRRMTVAANVITLPGIQTVSTDTFIIYTNINKIPLLGQATSANSLPVVLPVGQEVEVGNQTAFGEVSVAQITPTCAWKHSVNINTDIVVTSTTGTGAVSWLAGEAKLETSAAINSSATMRTKEPIRYLPGIGGLARFTARFATPAAGSQQLIGLLSADGNDGLMFGYDGTTFGVVKYNNGSASWTYQTSWNTDRMDGVSPNPSGQTIVKTNGNVYQLRYQYLGYGGIMFAIEDKETAKFQRVHLLKYANSNTSPSFRDPILYLTAKVINISNNTNIIMYTPSAMGGVEAYLPELAGNHPMTLHRTLESAKTAISTETNIITVRNKSTYASTTNRIHVRARELQAAADGTKACVFRGKIGATLGGVPSYADVSTNTSPLEYDTAGTTVTGGTLKFSKSIAKVSDISQDLHEYNIILAPGEAFTLSAASSANTDVNVSLVFEEYH